MGIGRADTGAAGRRLPGRAGLRRPHRLWVHLAALVLLPLVGLGSLVTVVASDRHEEAERATLTEEEVRSVGQLDTVRSALDSELMPTLNLVIGQDWGLSITLGISAPGRRGLLAQSPEQVVAAREATDWAIRQVPAGSPGSGVVTAVAADLAALRHQVDLRTVPAMQVARSYLQVSDELTTKQSTVATAAAAHSLSPASALGSHDLEQFLLLSQAAGRQLPLLLTARITAATGVDTSSAEQQWLAAYGTYARLTTQGMALATPRLRPTWHDAVSGSGYTALDAELTYSAQHPPQEGRPVEQLLGLAHSSSQRDAVMSAALQGAVQLAAASAAADRQQALQRSVLTIGLSLLVLVLAGAATLVTGRSLTRSLRRLATSAERISEGHLVDVPETGPVELRTVARALSAAVAGLRRVQGQALAVARGDLDEALREQPLPGPLGEVVHASVVKLVSAMSQGEQLQTALVHQAAHDALTDLPNRAAGLTLVQAALHRAQRTGSITGLLLVDLDHFKGVNDTLGHACGDQVLRAVAQRLGAAVRSGDVVFRLGGDEFVALVEPVADERGLVELADRLIAATSAPIIVGDRTVSVGVSVGIAASLDGATDADTFLAEADAAVHRAKAAGRGRHEVFDDALRAELAERAEVEAAVANALADGEMELYYQPVVDVATTRLTGYEALIRWRRPGHAMVPPDAFIPIAEGSSLICDLGRWVLHEATAQLATWLASEPAVEPGQESTVAVNVSGRHLADPRVLRDVQDALVASGLPPRLLVVEITETVIVDAPVAERHLASLRAMGVAIAIDDFGTGYTSISQLGQLPVDTLKIDRSFVSSSDPGHAALVQLVVSAAHTFGLDVVAEGVEDETQLEQLRATGCDYAQGYFFSRPVPAAEAGAMRQAALR